MSDDLISRQAILDMLEDINNHIIDGYGYKHDWCVEWVKGLPSIDAVQVIRCKDCEYWDTSWKPTRAKEGEYWCSAHDIYMGAEDYCSQAERKSNEEV